MFSISELMCLRDSLQETLNERSHADEKKLLIRIETMINDYMSFMSSL